MMSPTTPPSLSSLSLPSTNESIDEQGQWISGQAAIDRYVYKTNDVGHTNRWRTRLLSVLLLAGSEFTEVELEFLALKDIPVRSPRLTRSTGNSRIKTTGSELTVEQRIDLCVLLLGVEIALGVVGEFFGFGGFFGGGGWGFDAFLGYGLGVVGFVPLTEGGGIDLDDSALDESVRSDQLVVRGVIDDTDDTSLTSDMLRGPGKVPRLETEGTELFVTAARADGVDTLGTELGESRLTAELELSLFAVVSALGARGGSLVPRGASDTHD